MKRKHYSILLILFGLLLIGISSSINAQPYDTYVQTKKQDVSDTNMQNNNAIALGQSSPEININKKSKPWFSDPYPNPAQQNITLHFRLPDEQENAKIKLMDLTGKTIKTIPLQGYDNKIKINMGTLNRGMYFLAVYYKGNLIKSNALLVGTNH